MLYFFKFSFSLHPSNLYINSWGNKTDYLSRIPCWWCVRVNVQKNYVGMLFTIQISISFSHMFDFFFLTERLYFCPTNDISSFSSWLVSKKYNQWVNCCELKTWFLNVNDQSKNEDNHWNLLLSGWWMYYISI